MKYLNRSFWIGCMAGFMLSLLIILPVSLVRQNKALPISDADSYYIPADTVDLYGGMTEEEFYEEQMKGPEGDTTIEYVDSLMKRINLENHVGTDYADKWNTYTDSERVEILLNCIPHIP